MRRKYELYILYTAHLVGLDPVWARVAAPTCAGNSGPEARTLAVNSLEVRAAVTCRSIVRRLFRGGEVVSSTVLAEVGVSMRPFQYSRRAATAPLRIRVT